ncbi:MAG: HAMP domain-containing sensor histidine kinase [Caulobacteraceae bacterium]|nr:HAMP domain-containing sensor histidine kinase [Caulobacteraceae bacterium]
MRASRLLASTGVRLAFLQAILLITAFAVAGSLTKISVRFIYRHDVQTRILGEVAALTALDKDKGLDAVVRAVAQDERRPGGLEYRLAGSDGRGLSGDLPPTGAGPGWTYLDWDDQVVPGRPYQDLIIYTQPLPGHAVLTVGQDLSEESKLRHALGHMLFWCGAIGAGVGLVLSYLLGRGALRRVEGVVVAARAVAAGQMQVRAPARSALIPDDIDELGATFNRMLDEIATLVSRVRWVSTDIAHDLRTPLTHVRQKLERIKRTADGAILETAREIDRDVDELLRTFDAMLRLAEIENDASLVAKGPIDLADLTNRVIDAYRPDLEASGRRLRVSLTPALVDGDADLIAQALANLIENALRHTQAAAVIEISIETRGDGAVLSVRDDGAGIPADQREAVLQRFHRLEASRTMPGSGLGLPIVAAIAQRHGATLALDDAKPGLRVSLTFPKAYRSAPSGGAAARP